MDFNQVIENRHSAREFSQEVISEEILTQIIKDAQTAPSWANSQPWRVWIATGETLAKIKADHLENSQRRIRGNADFSTIHREDWDIFSQQNMSDWYRKFINHEGKNGQEFGYLQSHLYHAPALVYLTIPKASPAWSIFDLGAFSMALMLSATSKGIGSLPAYELVKYPDSLRQHLQIPNDQLIATGIALGYTSENQINTFRSDRLSTEKILTFKN